MFVNAPVGAAESAIRIINDPKRSFDEIRDMVRAGYIVRTRADADTIEARNNDTSRREAAFASGAQIITTDYYLPAAGFATDYQVTLPDSASSTSAWRCNPVSVSACQGNQ